MPRLHRVVFVLSACLLAAACGGGGGGGSTAVDPGSSPTPPAPSPSPSPAPSPPPAPGSLPDLGPNADMRGVIPFPASDPWNTRVDGDPVDPQSDTLIASIGAAKGLHPDFGADLGDGQPFGIPYVVVSGTQPLVPVAFDYADESDPGPYPIPADAPIEGGAGSTGDRHVLVIDRDHGRLFETWSTWPTTNGWTAGSGATFDFAASPARPAGWTSADAAGLPIFPGLVRYDEVAGRGEVRHALRFTIVRSRRAYVAPATHYASSYTGADRPPMGMRVRLRASFDESGFPPQARVILTAMKRYGMIVADNGGDWFVSGAPDTRWDDDDLNTLKGVTGANFEVVKMGPITAP